MRLSEALAEFRALKQKTECHFARPEFQVARQPDDVQKACTAISKLLVSNTETTLPKWKPTEGRKLPARLPDGRPQPFHGRVYCLLHLYLGSSTQTTIIIYDLRPKLSPDTLLARRRR
jgi:hypothetical protein